MSVSPPRGWVTWRPEPRFPCLCSLLPRLSRYLVTSWNKWCLFLADHPRDLMIEGHASIFKYSKGIIIVIHSDSSTSFSKLGPESTDNYLWNVWVIWGNQVVTLSPSLFLEPSRWPWAVFCCCCCYPVGSQEPWFPRKDDSRWNWAVILAGLSQEAFRCCFCKLTPWTGTSFCLGKRPRKRNLSFYSEVRNKGLPTTWRCFAHAMPAWLHFCA